MTRLQRSVAKPRRFSPVFDRREVMMSMLTCAWFHWAWATEPKNITTMSSSVISMVPLMGLSMVVRRTTSRKVRATMPRKTYMEMALQNVLNGRKRSRADAAVRRIRAEAGAESAAVWVLIENSFLV